MTPFSVELSPNARSAGEGVAHDALDTEAGVETLLDRDLLRGPDAHRTAGANVRTFGALPAHHHVDVLRTFARQGRGDTRVQLDRSQVDVVVEAEPPFEQQATLEDTGRHGGIADSTEQDRVVAADVLEFRVRQYLAGAVVPRSTEVEVRRLRFDTRGLEHAQSLLDHLRADAVARNGRDPICHG